MQEGGEGNDQVLKNVNISQLLWFRNKSMSEEKGLTLKVIDPEEARSKALNTWCA